MWHPEMSEDKILDLVNEEGFTKDEPETYTEAEAAEIVPQESPKQQ